MQSGILERIRQLHADVEQHRAEITMQMLVEPKNFRHELMISHFIANKAKLIAKKSDELLNLYEDQDYELAKAQKVTVSDAIRDFEAGVANLREYHRAHPQQPVRYVLDEPTLDDCDAVFSSDERHGRCLALQAHYSRYVAFVNESAGRVDRQQQSKNGLLRFVETRMSYEEFARKLPTLFHTIPAPRKAAALDCYSVFVIGLLAYLEDFFGRVRPLHKTHVASMVRETTAEFEIAWNANTVPAWDRSMCGDAIKAKKAALAEAFVERYLALLSDLVQKTADFCEQQLTKNVDEIEREMEEEEEKLRVEFAVAQEQFHRRLGTAPEGAAVAAANENGSDPQASNPIEVNEDKFNRKNFPLDDFGNPIPVWLYHLHGLHQKFHCEVCSYTYYGERSYSQHFSEQRHLQGLRVVGVPEFVEELRFITERDKVKAAWAKWVERDAGKKAQRVGAFLETEDVLGNLTRRGR